FYHFLSYWFLSFLRELTIPSLVTTGDDGTYSLYSREGDYLDIHRDIVSCEVAVITCLKNEFDQNYFGGQLALYPDRLCEPLSQIKATPEKGAVKYMLEEGQTLIMYGGFIPHALLPLAKNQTRIVSVLCYQAF
nr:hypothetical protein [Pyrinomonadaceae bacterium]